MTTRSQRLSTLLLLPLLGLAVPAHAQEKLIQMTVGLGDVSLTKLMPAQNRPTIRISGSS